MFTPRNNRLNHHAGLTLIEVMVASTLGVLIISGLFKMYVASQQSLQLQTALNQIQQHANAAIYILSTEIQQAGYIGCAKLTPDFPLMPYHSYTLTVKNKRLETRNTLTVRHAAAQNVDLLKPMANPFLLEASDEIHFKNGHLLIISDCEKAEIFQVQKISHAGKIQKIFSVEPLHYNFSTHAEVSNFEINHFFVEKTKHHYTNGEAIFALYVSHLQQKKILLVEGITNVIFQANQHGFGTAAMTIQLDAAAPPLHKSWFSYVPL